MIEYEPSPPTVDSTNQANDLAPLAGLAEAQLPTARDDKGRFLSGNRGGGRPKGSRNKLTETFITARGSSDLLNAIYQANLTYLHTYIHIHINIYNHYIFSVCGQQHIQHTPAPSGRGDEERKIMKWEKTKLGKAKLRSLLAARHEHDPFVT
jgi:hypothetical protein